MGRVLLEAPRDHEFARAINAVFPILIDTLKTGSPVTKRLINDKENPEQVPRIIGASGAYADIHPGAPRADFRSHS